MISFLKINAVSHEAKKAMVLFKENVIKLHVEKENVWKFLQLPNPERCTGPTFLGTPAAPSKSMDDVKVLLQLGNCLILGLEEKVLNF